MSCKVRAKIMTHLNFIQQLQIANQDGYFDFNTRCLSWFLSQQYLTSLRMHHKDAPCIAVLNEHDGPRKSKFWKNEKNTWEILSFYTGVYTIRDNHVMYGSWDMERDRQNFFSFWPNFCTFTPLTRKIKIWKTEKMPGDIII